VALASNAPCLGYEKQDFINLSILNFVPLIQQSAPRL
jgi:hypothetical protein